MQPVFKCHALLFKAALCRVDGKFEKARRLLKGARCKIVVDRGSSLYFQDPFGNVFDVIED